MLPFLFLNFLILSMPFAQAESVRETPIVKVIRQCAPSVVNIGTERVVLLRQHPFWGKAYGRQLDDFFNQYAQKMMPAMKLQSLGSGVVVSADGLIVTNAHVVNMASKIYVQLQNGEKYEARLIGTDLQNDLALIQIQPQGQLQPVEFSSDILIGEPVVAVGNPYGLQNSVSAGIVSGTHRTFSASQNHTFRDLIQTDAPVNPGNSGGALFNLEGKLMGVNLAIVQNAQSIGFAVSSEKIKYMLEAYDKAKANLPRAAQENNSSSTNT